jgi:hypothetical protein
MSLPTDGTSTARALPARPNLEHLKNEAKGRLDAVRATHAGAKLADAQFQLAREYGFSSWRELKAEVDRRAGPPAGSDPVGDWIRDPAEAQPRIALHVWRAPAGGLVALADSPDGHRYDLPVDAIEAHDGRLTLTMSHPSVSIFYEARWEPGAQAWQGVWRQNGLDRPMSFMRGAYPPEPVVEGLDGLWDGVIGTKDPARITFRIKTDAHGTRGRCDSPDRSGYDLPVIAISRQGRRIEFRMQSAAFTGELSEDGECIAAVFTRGEVKAPLTLMRRPPGAPPPAPPRQAVKVPGDVLSRYAGRYRYEAAPATVFSVSAEDGDLQIEFEGLPRMATTALSETEFFCQAADANVRFEVDPSGGVSGLVFHQQGRDFRARRA